MKLKTIIKGLWMQSLMLFLFVPQVLAEAVHLEINKSDPMKNQVMQIVNMLPKDQVEYQYSIQVNHKEEVELLFRLEKKKDEKDLLSMINIKVIDSNTQNVVVEGKIKDVLNKGYPIVLKKAENANSLVNFNIVVEMDKSASNEYQNAAASIDMMWYIESVESLYNSPKTLVKNNMLLVWGFGSFIFLILILIIRRKSNEEK